MQLRHLLPLLALLATSGLLADGAVTSNTQLVGQATQPSSLETSNASSVPTNAGPSEIPRDESQPERALQRKILVGFMAVMLVIAARHLLRKRANAAAR